MRGMEGRDYVRVHARNTESRERKRGQSRPTNPPTHRPHNQELTVAGGRWVGRETDVHGSSRAPFTNGRGLWVEERREEKTDAGHGTQTHFTVEKKREMSRGRDRAKRGERVREKRAGKSRGKGEINTKRRGRSEGKTSSGRDKDLREP
jgi:hypothetical protein